MNRRSRPTAARAALTSRRGRPDWPQLGAPKPGRRSRAQRRYDAAKRGVERAGALSLVLGLASVFFPFLGPLALYQSADAGALACRQRMAPPPSAQVGKVLGFTTTGVLMLGLVWLAAGLALGLAA